MFRNPPVSVLAEKKLYIFDMDGTIYLGDRVFPYAIRFIDHLRASGKRVLFFTNNASRAKSTYVERLRAKGFSPTPEEIMTSGDVTIEFLRRHRAGKSVFLLGTPDLTENFREAGIPLVGAGAERADIVVTSFDTTLTYDKMCDVCRLVRGGAEYLSTHPDFNCPTENGFIPDSGAISAFVTASTGKTPTYFGKPYRETVEMICEASGCRKEEMCFFGDRLYTDIAVGRHHGVTAVLVLSGESTEEEALAASEADRPDFIFPSLSEVDEALYGV